MDSVTIDLPTHLAVGSIKREPRPARPKAPRRIRRALWIGAGLALCALLVLPWLPSRVPVETGKVARGPLRVTVDQDGRTRVRERYVVSAPLSGTLARIQLHAGDPVKRGEVLARIVPLSSPLLDHRSRESAEAKVLAMSAAREQAKAHIERVQSGLAFAKQELERQSQLRAKGAITQADFDRFEMNARTSTAELAAAQFAERITEYDLKIASSALMRLRNGGQGDASELMEVASPIDGRVLKVSQASEGVVQAGAALLELGDPGVLEIAVDVLTSDALNIRPGAPVFIERTGAKTLPARVRRIEPSAFTRVSALGIEEQRVYVIIDLEAPREAWAGLGDGYRVDARIVVWEAADVLAVPTSAVFRRGNDWATFVVDGGTARVRKVQLGQRDTQRVQIESGLVEGQFVVLHPSDKVVDGVQVEAIPTVVEHGD